MINLTYCCVFSGCSPHNATGPHDLSCLNAWWAEAGCEVHDDFQIGYHTPEVEYWNSLTAQQVQQDMLKYSSYQTIDDCRKCYGQACTKPAIIFDFLAAVLGAVGGKGIFENVDFPKPLL